MKGFGEVNALASLTVASFRAATVRERCVWGTA